MGINWKNNYVVKSISSRPVLFAMVAFMASMFTYIVTEQSLEYIYKTVIEKQVVENYSLRTQIHELRSEITRMKTVVDEEFDPETGKLIKRKMSQESESESSSESSQTTIEEAIIAKYERKLTEETRRSQYQNYLFVGYGMSFELTKEYYMGYSRRIWLLDAGIIGRYTEYLPDSSVALTLGLRF